MKNPGGEGAKKPFTVNIPDDDFIESIPAPEGESRPEGKPHKVVRYVDNTPRPQKHEKKKSGAVGGFIAGAAAGVKTVGEGISAGIKTVSEKKPEQKTDDETRFPKADKKGKTSGGIMNKLKALPVGAIIGGAAVILVALVAMILIFATSCSAEGNEPAEGPSSDPGIVVSPENGGENETPGTEEDGAPIEIPGRKEQFVEAYNTNNDVVGWLYIPGLEDVDAGVCFSKDSSYPYNKRDITGKSIPNSYWLDGAYYTHFRNTFGETSEELSANTVIFGHSDLGKENLSYKNDDPDGPLFSQLFRFKDPSFAEKTPFIYLSLPGEDTAWEVFAVFYNDAKAMRSTFEAYHKKGDAGSLWYIEPTPGESELSLIIENAKARSLYDYDVAVSNSDKIITLSTCTVGYGLNTRENYRFVIMAKLVEYPETEHIEKNAVITVNADAPVPETFKKEFGEYASSWKPSAN